MGGLGVLRRTYVGISLAFLYYFIQTGVEQDGKARSVFLHSALDGIGFNTEESHFFDQMKAGSMLNVTVSGKVHEMSYKTLETRFQTGGFKAYPTKYELTTHALEHEGSGTIMSGSALFWRMALAILMDFAFISFCFNMLPIITLDGADFFGSWVRLCTTPMVSAIFIICTSFICIGLIAIFQFLLPLLKIIDKWDSYKISEDKNVKGEQSPWKHPEVITFLAVSVMILLKVGSLLSPTIKLTCHACKDKLYKYHFTQDHEGKQRDRQRKQGYGCPPNVVIQPNRPHYGRAIDY